jgi:protein O-GlcNAc transferase
VISRYTDERFRSILCLHLEGQLEVARAEYEKLLVIEPAHEEALHHLGLIWIQKFDFHQAHGLIQRCLEVNPSNSDALTNFGFCLNALGHFSKAVEVCLKATKLRPDSEPAHTNLGNAYLGAGQIERALQSFSEALRLQPHNSNCLYNVALCHIKKSSFKVAIDHLNASLELDPTNPEALNNLAACLVKMHRPEEALAAANRAVELNKEYPEAWTNKGLALNELRRHAEALSTTDQAIMLCPEYAEAWNNKGKILSDLRLFEEALVCYSKATVLRPGFVDPLVNQINALDRCRRFDEVISLGKDLRRQGHAPDYLESIVLQAQMRVCAWESLEEDAARILASLRDERKPAIPFLLLCLFDDPAVHLLAAQTYWRHKFIRTAPESSVPKRHPPSHRIRVGYYSADFRDHPVAHLTRELFESHNRENFEIVAFYLGPPVTDFVHRELRATFDSFHDISLMSDNEVRRVSKELGIDIAVDLGGYTADARPELFSERLAPIQINFLGFPGTLGSPQIDYLVADKRVVSASSRRHFSESVIFLPNCYQPNDSKRRVANLGSSRAQAGLPDDCFVFACFNHSHKILPDTFSSWMRILREVPRSVIWLLRSNDLASSNLLKEALTRGVSSARIIFADPIPVSEHLGRLKFADLFLDTFPYTAHTTASDALWAGLPVLTREGKSFQSRVAASLLSALGLEMLITQSSSEFEEKAMYLASHPSELECVRAQLMESRFNSPLFSGARFAAHLEEAYERIFERYNSGLSPEDVSVEA